MLFFLTFNKNNDVSFSPLEKDKLDSRVISYLSVPIPLGIIEKVLERSLKRQLSNQDNLKNKPNEIMNRILRYLNNFDWDLQEIHWKEVNQDFCPEPLFDIDRDRKNKNWEAFNQRVLGRQLSKGDLQVLARELRLKDEEIITFAQLNVEQGKAQWLPSVKQINRGWQCQRCGETDLEEWPSVYGSAATCRSCASIGISSSLTVLYRDNRPLLKGPLKVSFRPHWVLTEAQQRASEQVAGFMKDACKETALLWAACGAGKTEVCFPAAAWALKQGKSVLFAAPRQDVIHDIAPRLQRDFPNIAVQVLTGTTTIKFQAGGLVLATTHQVLRFWRAFDVIFMDEMDAFPYHGSRALEWGLKQALRQGGKLLYLTATPSQKGLKAVREGEMALIRLPARHHRNPLPVPTWTRSDKLLEPKDSRGRWVKQISLLRRQGPVLVFVPKISLVNPWIQFFKQTFPGWNIGGSYSSDSGRSIKIKTLKLGLYDIFVSTTILERGITLPGIQIVVLGADHPTFDERALVQMAGRVGRTRENPRGEVIFLSQQMTSAMKTAVQWIEEQNRYALELGLIDLTGGESGERQ